MIKKKTKRNKGSNKKRSKTNSLFKVFKQIRKWQIFLKNFRMKTKKTHTHTHTNAWTHNEYCM